MLVHGHFRASGMGPAFTPGGSPAAIYWCHARLESVRVSGILECGDLSPLFARADCAQLLIGKFPKQNTSRLQRNGKAAINRRTPKAHRQEARKRA
jgi:hypothetical protein